jgi:hypothetical protein
MSTPSVHFYKSRSRFLTAPKHVVKDQSAPDRFRLRFELGRDRDNTSSPIERTSLAGSRTSSSSPATHAWHLEAAAQPPVPSTSRQQQPCTPSTSRRSPAPPGRSSTSAHGSRLLGAAADLTCWWWCRLLGEAYDLVYWGSWQGALGRQQGPPTIAVLPPRASTLTRLTHSMIAAAEAFSEVHPCHRWVPAAAMVLLADRRPHHAQIAGLTISRLLASSNGTPRQRIKFSHTTQNVLRRSKRKKI